MFFLFEISQSSLLFCILGDFVKMKFLDLDICEEIGKALEKIGFDEMTTIQEKAIPLMMSGEDVIGKSQTGTGKTLAFAIPAIEKVKKNLENGLTVLVLCPTRELVCQVNNEIKKMSQFLPSINSVAIYGGVPIEPQIAKLRNSNIVVGTPGRVIDHIKRKTLKLKNINLAVLDEADEMLDMGFRDDIETILTSMPDEKQVVLFSATMPPEILMVTKKYQKNPKIIEINKKHLAVADIKQVYYNVPANQKMVALNMLLKYIAPKLVIIFCNTKKGVDELNLYLYKHKFNSKALHGDMNQIQRQKTLDAFKYANSAILIATDVAARGIDISDIDCVVNFDIPQNIEYYVHRIGRTGRAGKSGLAVTLCSGSREVFTLKKISRVTRSNIAEERFPDAESIRKSIKERQFLKIKGSINSLQESDLYEKYLELLSKDGFSLNQIAKGALNLYFKSEGSVDDIVEIRPPIENPYDKKVFSKSAGSRPFSRKKQLRFGGEARYKQISINFGKNNAGLEPKHVLGAITSQSSLEGKDIGRIDIRDDITVVSVKDVKFGLLLDELGKKFTIKGKAAKIDVF